MRGKTYASFSKVTVADLGASGSPETGVTEMEVILPLYSSQSRRRSGDISSVILPEAKEVLDFLLRGGGRDARDMDCAAFRHDNDEMWFSVDNILGSVYQEGYN